MKNKTLNIVTATVLAVSVMFPTASLAAEGDETTAVSEQTTGKTEESAVSANHEGIAAFVARIYTTALEREYDQEGLDFWCGELEGNRATGLEIFQRITDCPEFTGKNLTDEGYLNVLYRTFFDRDPDVDGLEYWLNAMLNEDYPRDLVLSCFADSPEWTKICEGFGILPGNSPKADTGTAPEQQAAPDGVVVTEDQIGFVKRLYTYCLGREADEDGLRYWTELLAKREIGGRDAAYGFFTSEEFKGLTANMDKAGLIKVFYTVFLNRVPSDQEVSYWKGLIAMGNEVAILYNGISGSYEFADICSAADIYLGDFKAMETNVNDPNFASLVPWNMQEGIDNLSNAVLIPKRTYKFVNIQGGERNYEEHVIPDADIQAIEAFAERNFSSSWSAAQKAAYTCYWLHYNMAYDVYGSNTADTFAVSAFVKKAGQCAQYNGALVEMMCYLGFDACLVQGKRMSEGYPSYQHFWGEVYVNGATYVLEAGNTKDGNWHYFAVPYSQTKKYVH